MGGLFALLLILAGLYYVVRKKKVKDSGYQPPEEFPAYWRVYLDKTVAFYRRLTNEQKEQFHEDILDFLRRIRITGIKTTVNDEDRLLVASSAVIPVFAFPDWKYSHLNEVLLYPMAFNSEYDIGGEGAIITGMVGSQAMDNLVILSKLALHEGFKNSTDKMNVGIHEFVHLFDKEDRHIDGLPQVVMDKQYILPWLKLIQRKTQKMLENKTDINLYGATNNQEFLAVTSEYFFERPELLERKHPELYKALAMIFNTDLAETKEARPQQGSIGRNDPCPCQSGKKFKHCCLNSS